MGDLYDTLYCEDCGSKDVEMKTWVNANTGEVGDGYFSRSDKDACWCNRCQEHVRLRNLSELWEQFGEVKVNENDEIEEDFLCFKAGISKFDVWHWFDERCPNNLHDDLLYPTKH